MGLTAQELVRHYTAEVVTGKRFDLLNSLVQADVTFHDPAVPGGVLQGVAALKQAIAAGAAAMPDFRFTVDAVLGQGDLISWRGRM